MRSILTALWSPVNTVRSGISMWKMGRAGTHVGEIEGRVLKGSSGKGLAHDILLARRLSAMDGTDGINSQ